jgi:hypothetical protein
MKKIPVGATIAHAYGFFVRQFGTLLRVLWLPLLAQLVVVYFLMKRASLFLAAIQAKDPSAATLFGPLLLLLPIAVILFFVQLTAAMETAMGQPPPGWFTFPLGKKMWRLLGGFVAGLLAIIAVAVAALLPLWLLVFLLQVGSKLVPHGINSAAGLEVLTLAYLAVLVFCAIRFLFLLAPNNLSEARLGVVRAWHLSAGNFWRALLVALSILVPVWILNQLLTVGIAGFPPPTKGASAEAITAAQTAWRIIEFNALASHWYLSLPVIALLMLFQFGTGCAAQVFAYRALAEDKAHVILPE